MTPTKLLRASKRSVALAFTLASALLLGACGSAAGAAELETAQAQLNAAQAELDALLYALQAEESEEAAESEDILTVEEDLAVEEQTIQNDDTGSQSPITIYVNDTDRFRFTEINDDPSAYTLINHSFAELQSTYSAISDGNLVWGNFDDEGVLIHFEGKYAIEGAEIVDDFTLVVYVRPDGDALPNRFWQVRYFEDGGFMNLFLRIEHLTIINADTNNVMFSHQIHHGHSGMGVSSLAELRAYLGLD